MNKFEITVTNYYFLRGGFPPRKQIKVPKRILNTPKVDYVVHGLAYHSSVNHNAHDDFVWGTCCR